MNILRKKATIQKVGMSFSSINRLEKSGNFPKRIKLPGKNMVGWVEAEIEDWLQKIVEDHRAEMEQELEDAQ